jgi:hypothetical protein
MMILRDIIWVIVFDKFMIPYLPINSKRRYSKKHTYKNVTMCLEKDLLMGISAGHGRITLTSFHPEMALLRNLGVNLRDCLCDVPMYASAQPLELTRGIHAPRPCGQPDGCPIPLSCGIALDLAKKYSFLNWKLTLVPTTKRLIYGWALTSSPA